MTIADDRDGRSRVEHLDKLIAAVEASNSLLAALVASGESLEESVRQFSTLSTKHFAALVVQLNNIQGAVMRAVEMVEP